MIQAASPAPSAADLAAAGADGLSAQPPPMPNGGCTPPNLSGMAVTNGGCTVMTAGSDRQIRYWDLANSGNDGMTESYTITNSDGSPGGLCTPG
jgi:hypothetical protein